MPYTNIDKEDRMQWNISIFILNQVCFIEKYLKSIYRKVEGTVGVGTVLRHDLSIYTFFMSFAFLLC